MIFLLLDGAKSGEPARVVDWNTHLRCNAENPFLWRTRLPRP
jgi:hypothetical protein